MNSFTTSQQQLSFALRPLHYFQDGAVFHHWRRAADEGKEYPFARFNKVRQQFWFGNRT